MTSILTSSGFRQAVLYGALFSAMVMVIIVLTSGVWLIELVEAFAIHLVFFGLVLAVLTLCLRSYSISAILFSAVLALSFHTHPYLPLTTDTNGGASGLSVGCFNVYHHSRRYADCSHRVLQSGVDIACFLEVSHQWAHELKVGLGDDFPFLIQVPSSHCCWGLSLFSKYPLVSDSVHFFTRDPVIRATVQTPEGELDVWAVHTRPPIFPNDTEERNALMMMVAREIASRDRPVILAGDLNIVPWSADFKRMREAAGMHDARRGFKPTFPADFGLPLIPIDHVLHSAHFRTVGTRTVKLPGSDHRGFVASMVWESPQR